MKERIRAKTNALFAHVESQNNTARFVDKVDSENKALGEWLSRKGHVPRVIVEEDDDEEW